MPPRTGPRSWAVRRRDRRPWVEDLDDGRVERRDVDVGDERVDPADDLLVGAEEVFVELLAGPEAGVDDVDVPARLGDQPAGDIVEEHRLAHVEDEGLAAVPVESPVAGRR